jgi:hypothetical protein
MMIFLVIRFLHILSAAAWLGAAIWVAGDARRTLSLGKPYIEALPARIAPALKLDLWAGVATVLTGLIYIAALGGRPRLGVMIGFGLAVLRVGLTGGFLLPSFRGLASRISSGKEVKPNDFSVKGMALFTGVNHVLWVGALVAMVGRF